MNKPDNRKTIRISPELWAKIKSEAALAQCTIAEIIRRMFEKWKGER